MADPLPPAPSDVNTLSRGAWDLLRDKVNRADNLQAAPPLNLSQTAGGPLLSVKKIPEHRPGVIVCPPAGKPALSPPMAWVAIARVSNTEADPETALVKFDPWPPGSDFAFTVAAANLAAYHCGDPEQFKPGTPVLLFRGLDLGDPPRPRYFFVCAERADCLPPCPPPSSGSSGGSGAGCPCFQVTFYTGEGRDQTVNLNAGTGGWSDGTNFIRRNAVGGEWVLSVQAPDEPGTQTLYTAPGGTDCPPADVNAWALQDGNLPLLSVDPCPPSSGGSSGSSGTGTCANPLIDATLDCNEDDTGFVLTKYFCDGTVATEAVPCCCGSSSGSSGDGFTGDKDVVVDFDPDTCEVTKETWHFENGRLISVTA